MTPTLLGRWQTRLLLLGTVGLLVTLPFGRSVYFFILGYVALIGFFWDILYAYLQKLLWDRDWPGIFQFLAGIWEAIFLLFIIKVLQLELPGIDDEVDIGQFALHYGSVWLTIYVVSQSLMRLLFPRWRFRGGQWL